MGTVFPIVKPVLVKPLPVAEQEALQQHGCLVRCFPNAEYVAGHMVTFPSGVQMDMSSSLIRGILLFPDGYKSVLVWEGRAYHLHVGTGA